MNICQVCGQVCGIPLDARDFDQASIQDAPTTVGEEVELARYTLHPQYRGVLLQFAQYAKPQDAALQGQDIFQTTGYEWAVLCNNQPRDPYLPTNLILNPWGQNNLPIHLRLEEGCVVRLTVKRVSAVPDPVLIKVGGRLKGRYWDSTQYNIGSSSAKA